MSRVREWLRRWGAPYAYTALLVLAVFRIMDGITVYRPPAAADAPPPAAAPAATETGRVFVLLLDSLRYETAVSAGYMPHLSALRSTGTWAEVKPSYNAITASCLRAAFTGRDEVSVLGFVQNFIHRDEQIASVFSQLAAHGRRTTVFSDDAFRQFGAGIQTSIRTELGMHSVGVEDHEENAVRRALTLFREGRDDIVIAHVQYTDYAAHKFTLGTPGYRADFGRADRLVREASLAIGPADTLVVMGDHGHAPDGTHTLGQDVRTFAVYRGPAFRAGHGLGTIDIMSHRWLLSQIFRVPVPEPYLGARFPGALAASSAAAPSATRSIQAGLQRVSPALWVFIAVLVTFAAGLIWPGAAPWMTTPGARGWVWMPLLVSALPTPWNAGIGLPLSIAVLAWLLRDERTRLVRRGVPVAAAPAAAADADAARDRPATTKVSHMRHLCGAAGWRGWLLPAGATAAAVGWHGWGRLLATMRETIHQVSAGQMALAWLLVGVLVAAAATRANRTRIVVTVAGAFGLLAWPTNYPYGFTGLMVPLLWIWLAAYGVSLAREGRWRDRASLAWAAGVALVIVALTQNLAGIEGHNYTFRQFVGLVDFPPFDAGSLIWRGLVAKALIFFPAWPRRWLPAVVRVGLIALLHPIQWRAWEVESVLPLLIMVILGGGWVFARRRDPEVAASFALGLLFFMFALFVRPTRENFALADCVFAALVLAARWLRRWPQREHAVADIVVLGVVAFLAAGFVTTSWSIEKLEWSWIYRWLPPGWVEAKAGWIVPGIIAKTCLPLFIATMLLRRELGPGLPWPADALRAVVGLKVLTLLLIVTGLGVMGTVSAVYLEGVQQLTVALILAVGVAFQQDRQARDQPHKDDGEHEIAEVQQQHRQPVNV